MLKIRDGRGDNSEMAGKKNRDRVRKYFIKHPDSTKKACMEKLGLSFKTVNAHIKAIQKEG